MEIAVQSQSVSKEIKKIIPEKKSFNLKYERDKDAQLVSGIPKNYESPGSAIKFSYRKYKGEPIVTYDLQDGVAVKIPLGVAKHLNANYGYPEHTHILDDQGIPVVQVKKMVKRYGFQSLEFIDESDIGSGDQTIIVQAKRVT